MRVGSARRGPLFSLSNAFMSWHCWFFFSLTRQVPFLQMADKILSTGKYLNVVHECGRTVSCPGAREIVYSPTNKEYVKQIEEV